jgi:AbrB family looped-hinge helix DNA binding protein
MSGVKFHLTTMTRKGQITVPAEIRGALGLKIGDKAAIALDDDGNTPQAPLCAVPSVADMTFGTIQARKHPEDFKELPEAYMEQAGERDERTKRSM